MADESPAEPMLRALRRILRSTAEFSRGLTRATGLTVPQVLCLRAIAAGDPAGGETAAGEVTVVSISEQVQFAPATVSRILDRLERAGLVIRERRSRDRRKVCLTLTPAGRAKLNAVPTLPQEQFAERVAALSRAEQRKLLRSLEAVVDMLSAGELDAAPVLEPEDDLTAPLPPVPPRRAE